MGGRLTGPAHPLSHKIQILWGFFKGFNGLYNEVTDGKISGWQEKYFGAGMVPTNCSF